MRSLATISGTFSHIDFDAAGGVKSKLRSTGPRRELPRDGGSRLLSIAVSLASFRTTGPPDFSGNSALVNRLATYGLGEADWVEVTGLADRVAAHDIRHLPGSGEDLLLRTSTSSGAPLGACPIRTITPGELLSPSITSPASNYSQVPGLFYFELAPTGSLPGATAASPEFQLTLNGARPLHFAPQIGTGTSLTFSLNSSFAGLSLLIQGLALSPSAKTGNPRFTATDSHELRFQ